MTSYLSSLTQHYTSLKRLLPNSLSPDSDLSCTDPEDSHVSRVLRAYYTEKGRVFPPWLGPDPRAPEKSQPALVSQSRYGQPQAGGDDDGFRRNRSSNTPGALDDLFGNGPPAPPSKGREQPLRGPRGRLNQAPPGREPAPAPTARPLPSQRQGSNQNRSGNYSGGFGDDGPAPSAAPSREQTAAERLKARLGGARSTTPTESSANGYDRPMSSRSAGNNPYDRGGANPHDGGRGGASRGNPYQSSSSRNPYQSAPEDDRYGGGGASRPFTGASSPWVSGDDGHRGGSGGGGGGYGRSNSGGGGGGYGDADYGRRGAQGLPNNPRRR